MLQEATFANDEGARASDAVIVEVQKKSASDCGRRPLRIFQKQEHGEEKEGSAAGVTVSGNANRESVCELIGRKGFIACLQIINPSLKVKEVSCRLYCVQYDHCLTNSALFRSNRSLKRPWI